MSEEKPLHVRVAEALEPGLETILTVSHDVSSAADDGTLPDIGVPMVWVAQRPLPTDHSCPYGWDNEPCQCEKVRMGKIPRYDTDWAATGPLIEKYGFYVYSVKGQDSDVLLWGANSPHIKVRRDGLGRSPLVAVCHLLLELGLVGKL